MRGFIVFTIIFAIYGLKSLGQTQQLNIPYLEKMPVVDGLPDNETMDWSWKEFQQIEKTNPENTDVVVRYKIGYNYQFLYLLIESDSRSLVYRDRAYQNGDGFHLVIAKPEQDSTSSEFYVLQFSPANVSKQISARKAVWYYNIGLSGKSLSSATELICKEAMGKTYFEMILPWKDIPPYHPLFSANLGINLCFVKAIGDKDKNYYLLKYDRRIQSELSERKYLTARFGTPSRFTVPFSVVKPERGNIETGQPLHIKTFSLANAPGKLNYYFAIRSADNYTYSETRKELAIVEGINNTEWELSTEGLLPGGYKIYWKSSDSSEGEIPLTVLPPLDFNREKAALDALKNSISEGDYNTLLFMISNITLDQEKVKAYETAGNIRERINTYLQCLDQIKKGNDFLNTQKGAFRRAFISAIDSTLQPYTIRLPENFSKNGKKYPLFVMLHGSGSDDQNMLNNNLTQSKCIEIAPLGRGTSNCFTTDGAEVDVKEAIEDAIKNYPVDTSKIIIAGFSMGGYGAYRLFYEYPHLFRGVAVFSGHPNLAKKWIGNGYPDFLETQYLKPFKNVPLFIYHSKNDLNCPFDLTEQLVRWLMDTGAKVEFVTSEESGHGILDKEHNAIFSNWLKKLTDH